MRAIEITIASGEVEFPGKPTSHHRFHCSAGKKLRIVNHRPDAFAFCELRWLIAWCVIAEHSAARMALAVVNWGKARAQVKSGSQHANPRTAFFESGH